ncbi:MAG TPA: ribosomal protein S18-alanine N-acetyltransferase [bacterium]|jgi:ribosomal-protein-alanine N-acetyltransferase|nr:ribosomal protein S18-alanine N-acetyltransferase [bacterium]HQC51274.1 ribosomal protein S18-alanine N-acetyltransferase [bacterium]HQG13173.1 ribosomal protein S18-alanine N-acetyltransferase [bacterium]HQH80175.1 ribosomal protein S18-alanine N-acetyltransferase [bacterium]
MSENSKGSELNIVRFDPSQLDEIMKIEVEAFTLPWSRQSYEEVVALDTVEMWVAKSGDEVVAYMLIQRIYDEMELHTFAVKSSWRRKGIGRRMLNKMLDLARGYDVERIYLLVRHYNVSAKNLYESLGFKIIGVRKNYYQDDGADALVMCMNVV